MERVSVYAAKAHLSRLLDRAAAGEEIIITRHGKPLVKLVPAAAGASPRQLGRLRDRIQVREDLDAPLPDEILDAFEGKE